MLEQPRLLLGPWLREPTARTGSRFGSRGTASEMSRSILDLNTHEQLGRVRRQLPTGWPVLRWLSRQTWQVLETDDDSLLLTIFCPWALVRHWEVRDAEDHLVCSIHRGEVYDAGGYLRAYGRGGGQPGEIVFCGQGQVELASLRVGPQGVELQFAPPIDTDPYAKMALLAAALTLGSACQPKHHSRATRNSIQGKEDADT